VLSLRAAWDLGGGFAGKDEDLLVFTPTSLGAVTAGTFSWGWDGSTAALKLGSRGEDVDAVSWRVGAPEITISTAGAFRVPVNLQGDGADLPLFRWQALGTSPAGTWTVPFRGGVLGPGLNVDALHVDQ